MSDQVRDTILWTVACALIFYWFIAFTAKQVVTPQSYIQKVRYVKICRLPGGAYRP